MYTHEVSRSGSRAPRPPGVAPGPPLRRIECGDGAWVLWKARASRPGRGVIVQKVVYEDKKPCPPPDDTKVYRIEDLDEEEFQTPRVKPQAPYRTDTD